jgi:sterol desaturase/sphingolipid hydroxylase (fatty acid hydroxylase superfamily)
MAKKYVSNKDETARMFKSDFMEKLSHVHPAVPHLIFIPVILGMLYWSYQLDVPAGRAALLFLAGVLIWTLTEYVVHRFIFHVDAATMEEVTRIVSGLAPGEPALPALETLKQKHYFIAHGVHHDYPNDSRRLVMPPSVSVPLGIVFYVLFRLAFGVAAAPALFAGMVFGYLIYDTTHFAVHHWRLHGRITLYLKKHHFRHHYQNPKKDYGVSSPLWDLVFGTWGRAGGAEEAGGAASS